MKNSKSTYLRVRLKGGLGNQLFQSLVAYRLSQSLGRDLEFDTSWFKQSTNLLKQPNIRGLEIGYFRELTRQSRIVNYQELPILWNLFRSSRILNNGLLSKFGLISDANLDRIETNRKRLYLDGYFQNHRLLPDDASLQKLLIFPTETSQEFKILEREISTSPFIAFHIRRGDFTTHPEIYDVLTPNYYLNAIQEMRQTFGQLPVILFSDEPKDAILWSGLSNRIDFVVPALNFEDAGETLRLMSLSKGLIIANSTFSWWAAKLGSINKMTSLVIMPSRFTKSDNSRYQNFKVEGWTVMDSY